MKTDKKQRKLLEHCNERFYPYMEKVLERLPENVRSKEVLLDSKLKIISFDSTSLCGLFVTFQSPVEHVIVLNESLLSKPEFEIIHTIAHEIAHKVVSKGRTALHEMEAEKLVVEWGFEEESKAVDYHRPILESTGFDIGYKWAKENDLSEFEEFYNEWNEGRLSRERYGELLYAADPTSILAQMGCLQESEQLSPDNKLEVPEGDMVDDGSLDKGIVEGILYFLREKKAEAMSTLSYTRSGNSEFMERLKQALMELRKVFGCSTYSKYVDKLPDLKKAYLQMSDLLTDEEGSN